ncbi:hypothetical protein ASD64_02840 [Mesorhizobium sp. Root157]|uniref:hypothetical protein n=1 Tax=Mesorhizobium sp. Root157 TaxID=1736477 RepID=UPI0007005551|nr:hypothetical protein [Mesorhizobium sp. Root157]KQZ93863.1 hypothetical protein ASD64_02840 [Mesorhizobium sp. Root157]
MSIQRGTWQSAGLSTAPATSRADGCFPFARLDALGKVSIDARTQVEGLIALAKRGLPRMFRKGSFAHKVKAVRINGDVALKPEGESLRNSICIAMGLAFVDEDDQASILKGLSLADLLRLVVTRAEFSNDPGAMALALWAAAEGRGLFASPLVVRLTKLLESGAPLPAAEVAWILTAAIAAGPAGDTVHLVGMAGKRLMNMQSPSGLFPRFAASPAGPEEHAGYLADQTYAIQALARLSILRRNTEALTAAEACASKMCSMQEMSGRWWWRCNTRTGEVLATDPVLSVQQCAIAPMALFELTEAGGSDHLPSILKGLHWFEEHTAMKGSFVNNNLNVIWHSSRSRSSNWVSLAIAQCRQTLQQNLPASIIGVGSQRIRVIRECSPDDLGWLLYGWYSGHSAANIIEPPQSGGQANLSFVPSQATA